MLLGVVSFRKESVLITALQYSAGYMQATTCFKDAALCLHNVFM